MSSRIFDDVNKLLVEYDFGMSGNIPDNVKCLKCDKILINACHVSCGCRFCRVCVDGLLESGCQVCPGTTEFCKESNLSNFNADYRVQKKILKLVMKCPEEMCSFESELINMNKHLRVCPNKSEKCVFYGLGCDQSNVTMAKMNEHLQLASYSHMKILIDVIDNMRNEMDRLKESDETNKMEINRLKESDETNNNEINRLKEGDETNKKEIYRLKESNETNKNEIVLLKQDLVIKAERIELLEEEIKLIKKEKIDNLGKEIGKIVAKVDAGLNEIRQWRGALDYNESVLKDTMMRYQKDMETRMIAADKWMGKHIDGPFVWAIDNVAQRRKNGEFIKSEYFYGKVQPYKMQLAMHVNGFGTLSGTGVSIYLLIHSDVRDESIKWPLTADVSIRIVNKSRPNQSKSNTKRYEMKKPGYKSWYQLNNNFGDFDFHYADLCNASLLIGDCFVVECRIDLR